MNSRPPLSAVVAKFNNASTVARCLDSLTFCSEIVVLDSGSYDDTRGIAAARGAKVLSKRSRVMAAEAIGYRH